LSRLDGEPSEYECGAPWNEGEDGECDCIHCRAAARKSAREEREIDEWEERRRGEW
jgi:hypothetical protein